MSLIVFVHLGTQPTDSHAIDSAFSSSEDILKRLHSISAESLAANGDSIRQKVLFIASSLLNKYPSQDSAGHEHIADFLSGELMASPGTRNKIDCLTASVRDDHSVQQDSCESESDQE